MEQQREKEQEEEEEEEKEERLANVAIGQHRPTRQRSRQATGDDNNIGMSSSSSDELPPVGILNQNQKQNENQIQIQSQNQNHQARQPLGRQPRARTPGEMLARKQHLLGAATGGATISNLQTDANAQSEQSHQHQHEQLELFGSNGRGNVVDYRRQQQRQRVAPNSGEDEDQSRLSTATTSQSASNTGVQSTTGERLESLTSELLKINQQQQQQQNHAQSTAPSVASLGSHQKSTQSNNNQSYAAMSSFDQQQQQQQQQQQPNHKSIDDVYILLAKKEKDLQLAAELGKVLLERNDELSKANEKIAEDYSQKLELLEQDKHKLKRKLDLLDGEYENRLIELQTDCNILKNQLEQQQQTTRQVEKEKSKLIDDLVQQNQRLTNELAEATKSEELLSNQLEQVNERINSRLSNRQDHVAQVDGLQEEIRLLSQRKQDLERRLKLAQGDKLSLSTALDESGDKILLLEELLKEKEAKLGEFALEANELRDSSSWLSAKLESMICLNERLANCDLSSHLDAASVDGTGQMTKTNLTDLAHTKSLSERERSQLIEQLKELRLKNRSRMKANEMLQLIGNARHQQQQKRQRKLPPRQSTNKIRNRSKSASIKRKNLEDEMRHHQEDLEDAEGLKSLDQSECDEHDSNYHGEQATDLLAKVFSMLRQFQAILQHRKEAIQTNGSASLSTGSVVGHQLAQNNTTNDDSGISTSTESEDKQQHEDPELWLQLINSLKLLIEEMPCTSCQLMISERSDYEQLQKLHSKLSEELRRKNEEILTLSRDNIEQTTKLAAIEERCATLEDDLANCDKPKEDIVRLAWKARDEAVGRKNAAEISLAKTRIENMQISSQLMEVVQQKGELSQKLAQFEDDIHYFTQHSVRAKFTWDECVDEIRRRDRGATTTTTSNARKLLNNLSSASPTKISGAYSSLSPLVQLLNFSASTITNRTNKQQTNPVSAPEVATNHVTTNTGEVGEQPTSNGQHASGDVPPPPNTGGLATGLTQLTRNKFNLVRFWQKSSPTPQTPSL